jgi:hypothetical protein
MGSPALTAGRNGRFGFFLPIGWMSLLTRLDLILVLRDEGGGGLAALHHLAVLVMVRALIDDPIGRLIVADGARMKLIQYNLEIVAFGLPTLDAHYFPFLLGYNKQSRTN